MVTVATTQLSSWRSKDATDNSEVSGCDCVLIKFYLVK